METKKHVNMQFKNQGRTKKFYHNSIIIPQSDNVCIYLSTWLVELRHSIRIVVTLLA